MINGDKHHRYILIGERVAGGKGNDSFWWVGKRVHKSVSDSGLYLPLRNSPTVQLEPISEYLDCLLEFGKLEFPEMV